MKRRLIIRGPAKLDLAEAALWYHRKQSGLSEQFIKAIRATLDRVGDNPVSFPIVHRGVIRRALADRFPYAVYFVAEPEETVVIAILHTSRDHRRVLRRR